MRSDPEPSHSQTPSRSTPPASWSREPEGDATIEENWLFSLRRERYRSRRSGLVHEFYVVHLADAVNVIALTPDRRLLLVDQFRAGSGRDSLETPGGLLDPGEDPLAAGARELLEETGYAGDPPVLLNTVWSCPSLLTSRISTILITNARRVSEPTCDEGEELRLELVPAREVPRLLRDGRISHALCVQGLLWWLVSELPDTPLELPEVFRPADRQLNLSSVMIAVSVVALVLGSIRWISAIDPPISLFLLYLMLLLPSYLLVDRVLDPRPRSILSRSRPRLARRSLIRLLASFGLALFLWVGGALVLWVSQG
ncbi:NUDIX hydrolase [Tautonia sociabilis]|uniref:GDP-mannose pyrophosphatase n=1 Tax=Tautonia sociabilis TaxID=2080755 RepID=A0A432MN56_9BACT|nr:NUDIX hydrolase [Tautonia sociabilis]RUL88852.1 NUDIX hydrolase [Tautonia sociabilis]